VNLAVVHQAAEAFDAPGGAVDRVEDDLRRRQRSRREREEVGVDFSPLARREILANPSAATNKMASASPTPMDVDEVTATIAAFVDELLGP